MAGTGPNLRRLNITLLRDKSSSDRAQVPMVGAQIDVYRQGATLTAGTTIAGSGTSSSLSVASLGALIVSDTVKVGVSGPTLTIAALNSTSPPKRFSCTTQAGLQ